MTENPYPHVPPHIRRWYKPPRFTHKQYRITPDRPWRRPTGELAPIGTFGAPNFGPGIHICVELEQCRACKGSGRNPLRSLAKDQVPPDLREIAAKPACPVCDGHGKRPIQDYSWLVIEPADPKHEKANRCLFMDAAICPFKFKRPQLNCTVCRTRRVLSGEIPNTLRVQFYIAAIWLDRPMAVLKSMLMKKFLSIAEFLMS